MGPDAFAARPYHVGPDISAAGAASLAALPPAAVRPLLTGLTHAHLISEHRAGRFTLHDLLRGYASTLTHRRSGR